MSIMEELPAHLKRRFPCSEEEEAIRSQFSNNDDNIAVRDVRGPEKLDSVPNVAGVTHHNKPRGRSVYLVPLQMSPGSDNDGDSDRGGVPRKGDTS